jgi:structural maintenance of chromosome 4
MQPWAAKVSKASSDRSVAESERNLLQERASSAQRSIDEAKSSLEALQEQSKAAQQEIDQLSAEKNTAEKQFRQQSEKAQALQEQVEAAKAKAMQARQKAEEARSLQTTKASANRVLNDLTKLSQQGRLVGFHGRLGDLGRIDAKYDIAISTAAPALNNLVCETVKTGQECLEHLRRTKSGRATIMCLDQITTRSAAPLDTPENAPRLYDLVTPKDAKFAPVFYQAVKDTLVAKDMEQARRIAFSGKRWRVVTLQGQLIDTSGTMSGGGQRVIKGLMGNKIAGDEMSPEAVAQLERDEQKASEKVAQIQQELDRLHSEVQEIRKKPKDLELTIAKLRMTLSNCGKRMDESKRRIQEFTHVVLLTYRRC